MTGSKGQYILMHKNIPVVTLELDITTGTISSIGAVQEKAHVPVGIPVQSAGIDRSALNEWWNGRAIPASRSGIRDALQKMNVSDTRLLPQKCMGLSLSDQYWICPVDSQISWEKINFFENSFSGDVGNILLGKGSDGHHISLISPDNTSDGWLKKKWIIVDEKRCLLKGGSGPTKQEPYNEVLASRICERLQIPHVSYTLLTDQETHELGNEPYSVCENFVTPETELISAWYIMKTEKKPNHVSVYSHYLNCCERLGIPDMKLAVDRMLALDYLIVNEDRHQNNFGVIRKADTLEYLGAAPIYDSGTSLWFDKPNGLIQAGTKISCKPFKSSHEEQIKLVTDFSWLNFSELAGIDEELREIVRGSLFIDEARCEALCRGLNHRVKMLEKVAVSMQKSVSIDSTRFDVVKDVAYHGEDTLTMDGISE